MTEGGHTGRPFILPTKNHPDQCRGRSGENSISPQCVSHTAVHSYHHHFECADVL